MANLTANIKHFAAENPATKHSYKFIRNFYIALLRIRIRWAKRKRAGADDGAAPDTFTWDGFTVREGEWGKYGLAVRLNGVPELIKIAAMVRRIIGDSGAGEGEKQIVFDIGANIGMYSLQYSKFENTKVHSFEPVRYSFELLKENIANNRIGNVEAHNFGLSDNPGELYIGPVAHTAKTSSYKIQERDDSRDQMHGQMARFETIDNFSAGLGLEQLDFLKIDVEGHELSVLKGGRDTITRFKPLLQLELSKSHQFKEQIFQLLGDTGYSIFVLKHGRLYLSDYASWFDDEYADGDIFSAHADTHLRSVETHGGF